MANAGRATGEHLALNALLRRKTILVSTFIKSCFRAQSRWETVWVRELVVSRRGEGVSYELEDYMVTLITVIDYSGQTISLSGSIEAGSTVASLRVDPDDKKPPGGPAAEAKLANLLPGTGYNHGLSGNAVNTGP